MSCGFCPLRATEDVVEAAQTARSLQAIVIGFTGRTGGKLKALCDHCLCVDRDMCDRIQEIHQIAYHMVCEKIEGYFAGAA